MAIDSYLWSTEVPISDHPNGYNEREAQTIFNAARAIPVSLSGVCRGKLNEFAVTYTSPRLLSVGSGHAYLNGIFCWDETATSITLPPVAADTAFVVVLEANWTTQVVAVRAIVANSGDTAIPALVQSQYDVWQIPLCGGVVDNAGVTYQYIGFDWLDKRQGESPDREEGLTDLRRFLGGGNNSQVTLSDGLVQQFSGAVIEIFPPNQYPEIVVYLRLTQDTVASTTLNVIFNNNTTASRYSYVFSQKTFTAATVVTGQDDLHSSVFANVRVDDASTTFLIRLMLWPYVGYNSCYPNITIYAANNDSETQVFGNLNESSTTIRANKVTLTFNNGVVIEDVGIWGGDWITSGGPIL